MRTLIHKSESRGAADHGWLQAKHSFSFASWHNRERMHFGALRVLNDDIIAPKMGFGIHPHNNMEIITIPLAGELKHKDSMGNQWEVVKTGEVQVMSAGSGIEHSEVNGSIKDELNLFQIWIIPNAENVEPRYDQKTFSSSDRKNKLQTLVTGFNDSDTNALQIYQDASISRIDLDADSNFDYTLKSANHGVYVMVIEGEITIEDQMLNRRDAIEISDTMGFKVVSNRNTSLLFIEVPMAF